MTDEQRKETEQYITDTITGRAHAFNVGERQFSLFPFTLGKLFVTRPLLEAIGINAGNMQRDVSLEALRLAKEKRKECLALITYHTCRTKEEVFDDSLIKERIAFFDKELPDEDIATLLIIVLTSDKTDVLMTHYGIDKDMERMATVMRVKGEHDKNSITFGGKSIFGAMIDAACERYGWTKDYVVWGIDYTSLRLMLADKANSIYLTDEERKRMPAWTLGDGTFIKADDPKNKELIKNMSWK